MVTMCSLLFTIYIKLLTQLIRDFLSRIESKRIQHTDHTQKTVTPFVLFYFHRNVAFLVFNGIFQGATPVGGRYGGKYCARAHGGLHRKNNSCRTSQPGTMIMLLDGGGDIKRGANAQSGNVRSTKQGREYSQERGRLKQLRNVAKHISEI